MNRKKFFSTFCSVAMVTACGGCSNDNEDDNSNNMEPPAPTPLVGVFSDSKVAGLTFETATQKGTTNADGEFLYFENETVSFKVGELAIGELSGKATVTPADFEAVTNITQFLQSFDTDGNPDNGIELKGELSQIFTAAVVDFQNTEFDAQLKELITTANTQLNTSYEYVDAHQALTHLDTNPVFSAEGGFFAISRKELFEKTDFTPEQLALKLEQAGVTGVELTYNYTDMVSRGDESVNLVATQNHIDAVNALSQMASDISNIDDNELMSSLSTLFGDKINAAYEYRQLVVLDAKGQIDMPATQVKIDELNTVNDSASEALKGLVAKAAADETVDSNAVQQALKTLFSDKINSNYNYLSQVALDDNGNLDISSTATAIDALNAQNDAAIANLETMAVQVANNQTVDQQMLQQALATLGFEISSVADYSNSLVLTDGVFDFQASKTQVETLTSAITQAIESVTGFGEHAEIDYTKLAVIIDNQVDVTASGSTFAAANALYTDALLYNNAELFTAAVENNFALAGTEEADEIEQIEADKAEYLAAIALYPDAPLYQSPELLIQAKKDRLVLGNVEVNQHLATLGVINLDDRQAVDLQVYSEILAHGFDKEVLQGITDAITTLNAWRMWRDDVENTDKTLIALDVYRGRSVTRLAIYNDPRKLNELLQQAGFTLPSVTGVSFALDVINTRELEFLQGTREDKAIDNHDDGDENFDGIDNDDVGNRLMLAETQQALYDRIGAGTASIKVHTSNWLKDRTKVNFQSAIRNDGSLLVWEHDRVRVHNSEAGAPAVTRVYANKRFTIALRADNSVIGVHTEENTVNYDLLSGDAKVVDVAISEDKFAVLLDDGRIIELQEYDEDEPGLEAVEVPFTTDFSNRAVAIYATEENFTAVRDDGTVYFWGEDIVQSADDIEDDVTPDVNMLEVEIDGEAGRSIKSITTNEGAFVGILEDNSVLTWGDHGTLYGADMPTTVHTLLNEDTNPVVDVTANARAFAALRQDGSVVVWGANNFAGILSESGLVVEVGGTWDKNGDGLVDDDLKDFSCYLIDGGCDLTKRFPAAELQADNGYSLHANNGKYIAVLANRDSFSAIREDGLVVSWGGKVENQTWVTDASDAAAGTTNRLFGKVGNIKQLYANDYHFAALLDDGEVVVWGGEDDFVTDEDYHYPQTTTGIAAVYLGNPAVRTNLLVTESGELVPWGYTTDVQVLVPTPDRNKDIQALSALDGSSEATTIRDIQASSTYYSRGFTRKTEVDGETIKTRISWKTRMAFSVLMADGSVTQIGNFDDDRYSYNIHERYLAGSLDGADNSGRDTDQDGVLDIDEWTAGTDPASVDTDADGVHDNVEQDAMNTNVNSPLSKDGERWVKDSSRVVDGQPAIWKTP